MLTWGGGAEPGAPLRLTAAGSVASAPRFPSGIAVWLTKSVLEGRAVPERSEAFCDGRFSRFKVALTLPLP